MGQPNPVITFGIPVQSYDGRYYSRFPGGLPIATGGGAQASVSASSADGAGGASASAAGVSSTASASAASGGGGAAAGGAGVTSTAAASSGGASGANQEAEADWILRSTGAGVIWAHDFRSDNELDYFIRGENTSGATVTNPSPKPPGSLTLVSTPFGDSRAIRSKAFGTSLTATVPAAADYPAHDTQVWSVADASAIPDPSGTPYWVLVGNGTDSGGLEWVEVQSINVGANQITVRRKMTAESSGGNGPNTAPSFPSGYTVGRGPNGSWNRPFAAFPSGQNGKATADIGIANATVTKQRAWTTTTNSSAHSNFREGYFGHRSYWADAPSTYKDWTPQDGGGARVDAWDGDELYIQFRAKISTSRFSAPAAKMLFIQNTHVSGTGQFFWSVGPNRYGEQLPADEEVAGVTYGTFLMGLTGYADSAAPAGGYLGSVQSDSIDNGQPIQDGYPDSLYSQRPNNFFAWCFPAERWVTYLIHFKFGKDNATADPDDTLPFPTAPFPSASDASYRTTFELFVADEGDTEYKLITSGNDYTWFFGDEKYKPGTYYYNPPGLNTFWMSQNLNDYIGGGSVSPPAAPHWIDYTQCIVSTDTIPVPIDTPAYMRGMSDWDVRALSGVYAPSNGNTTMYDALPSEWKVTGQPNGADNVFTAWSGGAGDAKGRRLLVHGGGHYDSSNNGVHVYDFNGDTAPTGWTVAANSLSALAAVVESSDTYSDGKPCAIHSYDGLRYDPTSRRLYRCGGSGFGPGGGGVGWYGYYDFDTSAYVNLGTNAVIAGTLGSALLVSPDGTKLLYLSSTKAPQFINTSSGALTGYGSSPWGSEERDPCLLYDSLRDRYVAFDNLSPARAFVFTVNWGANTWSSASNTLSGANASDLAAIGACCFYDAARDLYWVFGNRTAGNAGSISYFYSVHPTTWAVTRYALNGSVSMGSGHKGGFNRFVWFPQWRIVGTVQTYNQPASLIKVPL